MTFKTAEQQRNATQVFESWELILFDKLKRNGELDRELIEYVLMDFSAARVTKKVANEYLHQQIADMREQIAEQKNGYVAEAADDGQMDLFEFVTP